MYSPEEGGVIVEYCFVSSATGAAVTLPGAQIVFLDVGNGEWIKIASRSPESEYFTYDGGMVVSPGQSIDGAAHAPRSPHPKPAPHLKPALPTPTHPISIERKWA